jgi:hypothetical protein
MNLNDLERLERAVTRGEWGVRELVIDHFLDTNHRWAITGGTTGFIAKAEGLGVEAHANAQFIAALRNAAPELFRRLREAEKLLREARPMVEAAKEHFDRLKSSFVESMNYDAACRSRDNESAARNLAARIDKHLGGA